LYRVLAANQRRFHFSCGDVSEKSRLHIGSLIHARWDAVFQEIQQKVIFALWRFFHQFHQVSDLFGIQGQRR